MYAEYAAVRGDVAIAKDDLLQIEVPNGVHAEGVARRQPCDRFGLHPSLEFVRELYDDGDAAFVANIGVYEPARSNRSHSLARLHARLPRVLAPLGRAPVRSRMGGA